MTEIFKELPQTIAKGWYLQQQKQTFCKIIHLYTSYFSYGRQNGTQSSCSM